MRVASFRRGRLVLEVQSAARAFELQAFARGELRRAAEEAAGAREARRSGVQERGVESAWPAITRRRRRPPRARPTTRAGGAASSAAKKRGDYDASSIKVLEGLEAVRKRPAMYIGDDRERACTTASSRSSTTRSTRRWPATARDIDVAINADGSVSVEDDGRGIPVDIHPTEGVPAVEVIICKLHAGGKFDKDSYKVSGGLHGVGVSVRERALRVARGRGLPRRARSTTRPSAAARKASELKVIGKCDQARHQGHVQARPRRSSRRPTFSYEMLAQAPARAGLPDGPRGLAIPLADERTGQARRSGTANGLEDFVEVLNQNKEPIHRDGHRHRRRTMRPARRADRGRAAVQRRLPRGRLLLRQQHQHDRGRHAPLRLPQRR